MFEKPFWDFVFYVEQNCERQDKQETKLGDYALDQIFIRVYSLIHNVQNNMEDTNTNLFFSNHH